MRKRNLRNAGISLLGAVILMGAIAGYQKWTVKKEIDLQTVVYTVKDIPQGTQITKDMVREYQVPGRTIPPNAVRSVKEVIGKYTAPGFGLSTNSLVFKDKLLDKSQLPNIATLDLKENEETFSLLVDIEGSLGNSILPGDHVNLIFRTMVTETGNGGQIIKKPVYGTIAANVRVTAAKDANASDVFNGNEFTQNNDDVQQKKRPLTKLYVFAVTPEQNEILNKAKMLGEVLPIVSKYHPEDGETELGQQEVINWINTHSVNLAAK